MCTHRVRLLLHCADCTWDHWGDCWKQGDDYSHIREKRQRMAKQNDENQVATCIKQDKIFEIIGIFHIWVTTLTFLGHVTSSVTWPFDTSGVISYRCSIVTESLSPTIFEIIGIFHIWVTTLTFLGHVTSSVTWPFDSPGVISYRCSIVTLQPFSR